MRKINTRDTTEEEYVSPKGTFASYDRNLSIELGRKSESTDLQERHPFDVEICRLPPGTKMCPYHSHTVQWEFYHIISGRGAVRDQEGTHAVEAGDAFLYKPNEPHQILNNSDADMVFYIIADNPIGDCCHYPDSNKLLYRGAKRLILAGAREARYLEGEED